MADKRITIDNDNFITEGLRHKNKMIELAYARETIMLSFDKKFELEKQRRYKHMG